MSIYICSDIHGQYGLYKTMLNTIQFSNNDELYILGDMIDRGPDSIGLLQDVISRNNVHCLMGNHELMMIDHYARCYDRDFWLLPANGGKATKEAFEKLEEREKEKIREYILDLYLQVELQEGEHAYLLSHSSYLADSSIGTIKAVEVDSNAVFDVVWDSPWRWMEYVEQTYYAQDGRVHVIGHVPVQSLIPADWPHEYVPDNFPCAFIDDETHLINIDFGCALYGKSAAMFGEGKKMLGLCCMNLTEYEKNGKENAFTYIFDELC